MTLKSSSYLLPKFISGPLTIGLILLIITIVNGTLLNFGKRYKDNLRAIFDQWPKLQLRCGWLSSKKTLNGIYYAMHPQISPCAPFSRYYVITLSLWVVEKGNFGYFE